MIANPVLVALAVALGVSLFGNALLTRAYLGVRDERTEAIGERDQARSAASTCSNAVGAMFDRANKLAEEGKAAAEAARAEALKHQTRANAILSRPASTPGNDCKSAEDRAREWLKSRK